MADDWNVITTNSNSGDFRVLISVIDVVIFILAPRYYAQNEILPKGCVTSKARCRADRDPPFAGATWKLGRQITLR